MLENIQKKFGLSGFQLKVLAMITMFIDHMAAGGVVSGDLYTPFRLIGRLAFPIFAFLLAEGAIHTSDRNKYLVRMGIFALISEVPFDLYFFGTWWYPDYQNIYFTLFLGLWAIGGVKISKEGPWNRLRNDMLGMLLRLLAAMILADLLHTDYGSVGVCLIVLLYFMQGFETSHKKILLLCIMVLMGYLWRNSLELAALVAFVPILLYNGRKGTKINKYIFYAFYPAHILLLEGIRCLIG